MLKKILLLLWAGLILFSANPINGSAETDHTSSENADLSTLQFKRIAVMPFLIGKLESPENPVEKPLSLPLGQLYVDADNLTEGADQIMTRLVNDVLKIRFADQMVSMEISAAVYADVIRDLTLDTPRKLAKKFGENLQADLVVVGSIWRFREKGTVKENPDSPASVAFSVYLIEVAGGKRLWRNAFDGSQKALSEDVLGGLKQVKMGLRWLSVNELARYGVKNVFRTFPLRLM
jgi:nucleotide-binding universal stress UspA family protein